MTAITASASLSSISASASINQVNAPGITITGRVYRKPLLTGQTTSYATYDDGWQLANNNYDYTRPENPEFVAELDQDAVDPYRTLKQNNAFGNLNRFTDDTGAQTYTNAYIIDHLTGIGWAYLGYSIDWATAITNANSSTFLTYTDWRLPNKAEYDSIMYAEFTSRGFDSVSPWTVLNMTNNGGFWSSTSVISTSTQAYYLLEGNAVIGIRLKTNSVGAFMCRYHY